MNRVFPPKPAKVIREKKPTSMRLPKELAEELDAARGEYSRTEAIIICIRWALDAEKRAIDAEKRLKHRK